jgi:hypothetical protein
MTVNKNIKFRFKTDYLNIWNPNHVQEPRTYTNKIEKTTNTHRHFLKKNPKLPYFIKINYKHIILILSSINNNSKQYLNNKNNIVTY